MVESLMVVGLLLLVGLFVGGYALAGKWFQGGVRVAMGFVFGCVFVLALMALFVGGCMVVLYTQ
jgi:hypothetical protein